MNDFASHLRYTVRSLLRAPVFTAATMLTIALGIGVNTAVFSVVYSTLLDPLPFREPARLVHISETHPEFPSFQVAAPDYADWQTMAKSFGEITAYTFQAVNKWTLLGEGEPENVQVTQASYTLFPMLGIQPLLGRGFTAEEQARKAPVVLLSESLWRRKFSSDPSVVGRTIRLVNFAATVVGVVPQRQAHPPWADIWMPLSFLDPALTSSRRFRALEVVARLKPGVTVEQAQAEMKNLAGSLARDYPDTNGNVGANVLPLSSRITGEIRPALLIAWAAVSLVLLLACANVAHLVMVRSMHRSREIAVRMALGASQSQLMRLLLSENLMVAVAGGALGAMLAQLAVPLLAGSAASEIPSLDSTSLPATLVFATGATLLCTILFALPAAFHARKLDLQQTLQQSIGASLTHRRSWFGAAIVAAEVALAFVVITGAGLLYRSFVALFNEDIGFEARGVLAVEIPLIAGGDWAQSGRLWEQQIAPRLRDIPGVEAVAAANCIPMTLHSTETGRYSTRFGVVGESFGPGSFPVAQLRWITPGYFQVLGIPLKSGRLFTADDAGKSGYIINETLARRFFPNQDAVGKQILKDVTGPNPEAVPILGVVGDVRDLRLELEPRPTLYTLGVSNRMALLIRSDVNSASLIPAVREAVRAAHTLSPITRAAPLSDIIGESIAKRRFALSLLGVFAALSAALTFIGVYGVVACFLSQRTREFAIRFALGAERGDVRRLMLRKFAPPTAVGLFAGGWLAYLFAQALGTQLYKLSPADPVVLAVSAIMLVLIVVASTLRPAAKAASISPTAILRE